MSLDTCSPSLFAPVSSERTPGTKLRLTSNPPRRAYWTEEALEQVLAVDPPPSIRLALMLGLWTGQRQADVLHMRWSDISDGWIAIEQRKSRRRRYSDSLYRP